MKDKKTLIKTIKTPEENKSDYFIFILFMILRIEKSFLNKIKNLEAIKVHLKVLHDEKKGIINKVTVQSIARETTVAVYVLDI